jgi:hypothetical protein
LGPSLNKKKLLTPIGNNTTYKQKEKEKKGNERGGN